MMREEQLNKKETLKLKKSTKQEENCLVLSKKV